MSVTRASSLYAVVINSTVIGGITAQSAQMGTEMSSKPSSAEVYARWQAMTAQNPRATFTTYAIASLLDSIAEELPATDIYSADIAEMAAGVSLYAQAYLKGSTRKGESLHRKLVAVEGMLGLGRLSCTHQQDATIEVNGVVGWDGTNDPIAETDLVSLPSGVTDAERYTLGAVTLESLSIPQVRSLSIDFGLNIVAEGSDSDIWPTFVTIQSINPVITLRGIDLEWLKSTVIPRAGKAITHANTTIYLRKRAAGSSFVANETEQHIKFTACGMAYIDTPMDATGSEPAECSLILPCKYDGDNDPLVIDTTSAIT